MGIYIIPVNYDLYIIWSQPAIYTELQLYTTCKVVNRMNDIQIMFYNLLLFLHSWIAFLFIITMINCMFIVRYFTIKQLHLILGQIFNRMNDIQIMFYNLLLFLHSWIAFLFIITMINCMFIVRYFTMKQLHLILGQIFIWGYEKEMWEWIISNCFEMLHKMIFFFDIICNDMYERQFNLYFIL